MIEKLNDALGGYFTKWQVFLGGRQNTEYFKAYKPVALGWKVADRAEYEQVCRDLHDKSDRIIETWMNDRWVAKLHLKEGSLKNGITIIKVMERRPGSSDAVGLDHVDFYNHQPDDIEAVLGAEKDVEWTHESNDVIAGYEWISVWFDGTEAKFKSDTVLDIVAAELQELSNRIRQEA
jgi:hypothetical protein